jgi:alkyl sulfatase BDS1-like metallo-beta-lactamase superfamily hydrolase
MWYLPKFKLINTAEDATHTMHNLPPTNFECGAFN